MQAGQEDTIHAYYAARATGDVECAVSLCTDDIAVLIHGAEPGLGFAAAAYGLRQLRAELERIHARLRLLELYATVTDRDGCWRGHVRQIATYGEYGPVLDASFRTHWWLRGGRICRLEQWHDRPLLRSFAALAEARD